MQYLLTFAIMLTVGLVISRLAENVVSVASIARILSNSRVARCRGSMLMSRVYGLD